MRSAQSWVVPVGSDLRLSLSTEVRYIHRVGFVDDPNGDDASLGESLTVSFLGREASDRYTTAEARALAANDRAAYLCLWGEEGALSVFRPRLARILGSDIGRILKIDRVMQPNGRIRFDLYVPPRVADRFISTIKAGASELGFTRWQVRHHIPYLERVGRGVSPAAGNPLGPPGEGRECQPGGYPRCGISRQISSAEGCLTQYQRGGSETD